MNRNLSREWEIEFFLHKQNCSFPKGGKCRKCFEAKIQIFAAMAKPMNEYKEFYPNEEKCMIADECEGLMWNGEIC